MRSVAREQQKENKISFDCLMACAYFVCLPLTVITTPFGSMLKVVTMPLVALLTVRLLMGKSRITFNYVHLTYIIYVLYGVVQLSYYSSDRAVTTTRDMALGLLVFLLISIRIYNEREKELIDNIWIVVGIICIVAAVTSKEVVSEIEERAVIRIFGFEEDQNQFCSYFIMPCIISVKRIVEKRKLTPMYLILIMLMMYSILKTGSRGGMIGVVFGIFAYIMIGIKSIRARIAICISAAIVAGIVAFVIFPLLPESVTERYSVEKVVEDKGSGRFDIWEYLVTFTLKKPERIIFGRGSFHHTPFCSMLPIKLLKTALRTIPLCRYSTTRG